MQKTRTKRLKKMEPLSTSVGLIYKKLNKNNSTNFISLMKNWENIIGKEYAKILSPVKINFKERCLVVTSNRNFSTESHYVAPVIVQKVNSFYGNTYLKNIKFIFQSSHLNKKADLSDIPISDEAEKKLEDILENCENSDIKDALINLGKSMTKKGKIK